MRYVWGLLAALLGIGLFVIAWRISPTIPQATIHAKLELCAISPDGRLVVCRDTGPWPGHGQISLWNSRTGERQNTFRGEWIAVDRVQFSPSGTFLSVLDNADRLTIWDPVSGQEASRLGEPEQRVVKSNPKSIVFSPDDRFLVLQEQIEQNRPFIIVWDLKANHVRARLEGSVSKLIFNRDGSQIALSRWTGVNQIQIECWRLDGDFPASGPHRVHNIPAGDAVFAPTLDQFATCRNEADVMCATIQLWDMTTGKETGRAVHSSVASIFRACFFRFSSGGRFLTSIAGGPLWDASAGLTEVGAGLNPLHISADDRWLLSFGENGDADLYDADKLRRIGRVSVPTDTIWGPLSSPSMFPPYEAHYHFTPDSKFVLVTDMFDFGTSNAVTGFLQRHLPLLFPAMTPIARLWDVQSGRLVETFRGAKQAQYSSAGQFVVTSDNDETVKIWNIPPDKPLAMILAVTVTIWLLIVLCVRLLRRRIGRASSSPLPK
jgi:WD40 repeat protein